MSISNDNNTLNPERIARLKAGDLNAGIPCQVPTPRTGRFSNFGAFAQGYAAILDQYLSLTAGLRFDNHNIYGNNLTGRLAAVSQPVDNLYAKIIPSSAFKAPSCSCCSERPTPLGISSATPTPSPS